MKIIPGSLLCSLLLYATLLQAQFPPGLELELSDGTLLKLCRQTTLSEQAPIYYYAPVNLRISEVAGKSEFSFLAYRQDSLSPIKGGLLHLLMVWGLTEAQFRETESLLINQLDSTAVLGGSVFLDPDEAHPTVEIISDCSLAELLRRSVRNSARTPLSAGSKLAISFSFSPEDAQTMAEALETPEAFDGIRFRLYFQANNYLYRGCFPAHFWIEGDFRQWMQDLK